MTDRGKLLTVKQAAARAGVTPSAWRGQVARRYAPKPDDPGDLRKPAISRVPRWYEATVDQHIAEKRPGERTDLRKADTAEPAEDAHNGGAFTVYAVMVGTSVRELWTTDAGAAARAGILNATFTRGTRARAVPITVHDAADVPALADIEPKEGS
jgi:hypothetical protein